MLTFFVLFAVVGVIVPQAMTGALECLIPEMRSFLDILLFWSGVHCVPLAISLIGTLHGIAKIWKFLKPLSQ